MANTISSTMMTPGAPSISQLEAREVGDEIRYLGIGNSVLTALIENSLIDAKSGTVKKSKGLISKRKVNNIRYEMFNRSPRPQKYTVSSGTEVASSGIVVASANGLAIPMMLYNPRNKTGFRIEYISSTTLKGATVGATTFSCVPGDVLLLGSTAVKAGSDTAVVVNGTDDQSFNTLQFTRLGVSIDWVMEKMKLLAGGERFTREKMYLLIECLRDMEVSMLLGDYTASYASKNTTTGIQSGYTTEEFPTTKGIFNLAANGYDMQGICTLEKLRKNLPLNMGDTVNDNQDMIAFCSNTMYGLVQELMQEKHYNTEGEGELKQFGIKCSNFLTSGPRLKLVKHSAFNGTALENQMLIFDPTNIGYVHLEGHDLSPNNGIQDNDVHGKIDELYAYYGIETKDAGKTITVVTNCF